MAVARADFHRWSAGIALVDLLCGPKKEDLLTDHHTITVIQPWAELLLNKFYNMVQLLDKRQSGRRVTKLPTWRTLSCSQIKANHTWLQ